MVIRPERRWPSRSCRSSKLTPAARKRRPYVCFKSWTWTCGRSAFSLQAPAQVVQCISRLIDPAALRARLRIELLERCASSLRDGLEETLTLIELGIEGALYRTLRTTNPIENLNGLIAHYSRNVKRWRDGEMALRWIAHSLNETSRGSDGYLSGTVAALPSSPM